MIIAFVAPYSGEARPSYGLMAFCAGELKPESWQERKDKKEDKKTLGLHKTRP